ncbi:MAG TPA: ArsA-related P-loop ATPase [Candidatus Binatia bacterium]|nr:ArsA-related P-loop ATPase [Candidatus Binatia bacterium]
MTRSVVASAADAVGAPAAGPRPDSLAALLGKLQVVVCCGSGGVGKTTVSAALAAAIATVYPKRVLVLTIDPARRLATALGMTRIGSDPVPVPAAQLRRAGLQLRGELAAAMLDQKSAWDRMVERYAPNRQVARRILDNRFYQGISDAFVGSHEYMAMEALYELHASGEYDCLVIDTPPSRNALDLLEAPTRISDYVGARLLTWLARPSRFGFRAMNLAASPLLRIADRLLGSDVLGELGDFVNDLQTLYGGVQERARAVSRLLRSSRVGFVVVTTLEPPAFAEAGYFVSKLEEFSMPLRAVVVNRVLPGFLLEESAIQAAQALIENHGSAARLARALDAPVDAASLFGLAGSFSLLSELARRDARQLPRLERLTRCPHVQLPLIPERISDLEGLARMAAML